MYYFYDAFQNKSGDALPGYCARLMDLDNHPVPIFADPAGTPISAVSGKDDAAITDGNGMLRFYVPSGVYHLQLSNPNGEHMHTEKAVPMFSVEDVANDLASDDPGKGAALVTMEGGGTVQSAIDGLAAAIEALPSPSDIDERARDALAAALVAGENITITPDDSGNTITISAEGGAIYTDEMARDAIGAALTDTGLAVVTPSDGSDTIDINVPAASASDVNAGTATGSAVTPDALAGSNLGTKTVMVLVSDPNGAAITTGDGKAFVRITSDLNGMNLVGCGAVLDSAGTGGGFLCQLRRKRSGSDVDMLSTRISLDSGENDSADAATAAAINGSNDDVATADRIYIDLDGVPTTAKGLTVWLQFRLP